MASPAGNSQSWAAVRRDRALVAYGISRPVKPGINDRRGANLLDQGQNSLFPRAALQPKSLAGQEKSKERIGHTVERFDEPGGDFRCNPKGRALFVRWLGCSSLMIG
jgi:hypothetical protein